MKNIIKEYNANFREKAKQLLLKSNKLLSQENNGMIFIDTNSEKLGVGVFNNVYFKVTNDFDDYKKDEIYTPFDLFAKIEHKNDVYRAFMELIVLLDKDQIPFIRVGTDYFRVKYITNGNGNHTNKKLIPFNKAEIKEDFPDKDIIKFIPKYDEFQSYPSNTNYKPVINGNYNSYNKVYHVPEKFNIKTELDKIYWSLKFMKHIFGDQLTLGLIYMKVIWEKPKQVLPVLTLGSELRSTGKSTYSNWLELIYGENLGLIGVSDMKSDFNSTIAENLITTIEETVSDSHGLVNKIKMLSTAKKLTVNKKFVAQYTTNFYSKIIILTNKTDKFLQIDDKEIRFWIRELPEVKEGNHNIEEDLKNEIPHFLYYLEQLPKVDYTRSRMVFTPEELTTKALYKVKKESKTVVEKDIEIYLDDFMLQNIDVEALYFTPIDIKQEFFRTDSKITSSRIAWLLKNSLKYEQNGKNGRYQKFKDSKGVRTGNGNYFILKNKYYVNEVPF